MKSEGNMENMKKYEDLCKKYDEMLIEGRWDLENFQASPSLSPPLYEPWDLEKFRAFPCVWAMGHKIFELSLVYEPWDLEKFRVPSSCMDSGT